MTKKIISNHQIRATQVRVIDEAGKQLGVFSTVEAVEMAKTKGLDLIQVTEKAQPPVCRIVDYGKYSYHEKKKHKTGKQTSEELKGIRLSFNISEHDLEVKVKLAEKFLNKGQKIKVHLLLRGREKALGNFGKEKIERFIDSLAKLVSIKVEKEIKREPSGFTTIVSKNPSSTS